MRFRNPAVVVLALAVPCTWYMARYDLVSAQRLSVSQRMLENAEAAEPRAPAPAPAPLAPRPLALRPDLPPHRALLLSGDPTRLTLEAGEHRVAVVVQRWAESMGLVASTDPQVEQVTLTVAAETVLDRTALRELLDARDVVLVVRDQVLHAVHRRNLAQKFGPPWDMTGADRVDPDRLVTRTIQIRHGAGNAIFATVRGLLTRDTNRIGNLLYVQGPERLLICDFARNVRYYEDVIASLDTPALLSSSAVLGASVSK